MKLCKWVVGMILAVTLFALPAAGDGGVILNFETVADGEGYTYVDDDGYSLVEFTVESEPVETSAVLPARLLVVNCGTAEFDTEIEVEEECNTTRAEIKKSGYVCPVCQKRYTASNCPANCTGTYTVRTESWELARGSFAERLYSIYDNTVPHLVGFAGFSDGGRVEVSEYADYSGMFSSLDGMVSNMNTQSAGSYVELFEGVLDEVSSQDKVQPAYVIFVLAGIPESAQLECIELAERIREYCGVYVISLGNDLDSSLPDSLSDGNYSVLGSDYEGYDRLMSDASKVWSDAVNRETTQLLPAGYDAVLTIDIAGDMLDVKAADSYSADSETDDKLNISLEPYPDKAVISWDIGELDASQSICVMIRPREQIGDESSSDGEAGKPAELSVKLSAKLEYDNINSESESSSLSDLALTYYTVLFEIDGKHAEPCVYRYILPENAKLPTAPEVAAYAGYRHSGWYPKYAPGRVTRSIVYTPEFDELTADIIFEAGVGGSVSIDGSESDRHEYADVEAVTGELDLTVKAESDDDDYLFAGWYIGDRLISTEPELAVTPADDNGSAVWTDRTYTAVFVQRHELVGRVELKISSGSAEKEYDGEPLVCGELAATAEVTYKDGTKANLPLDIVRTGENEYLLSDRMGWFVYEAHVTGQRTDEGSSENSISAARRESKVEVRVTTEPGRLVVTEPFFVVTVGSLTIVNNVIAPDGFDKTEFTYEIYSSDTGALIETITLGAGESVSIPIIGGSYRVAPVDTDVDGFVCKVVYGELDSDGNNDSDGESPIYSDGSVNVAPIGATELRVTLIYSPERVYHYAYINGYEDGTIRPLKPLTRAETAAIFYRLMGNDEAGTSSSASSDETSADSTSSSASSDAAVVDSFIKDSPYTDVTVEAWYYDELLALTEDGVFNGYPDGSFKPEQTISRGEFIKAAARFFAEVDPSGSRYAQGGAWSGRDVSEECLLYMFGDGIDGAGVADADDTSDTNGTSDKNGTNDTNDTNGTSGTNGTDYTGDMSSTGQALPISRAEAVFIINYALGRDDYEVEYPSDMPVFSDNSDPSEVYFAAIQEAAVTHECIVGADSGYAAISAPDCGE